MRNRTPGWALLLVLTLAAMHPRQADAGRPSPANPRSAALAAKRLLGTGIAALAARNFAEAEAALSQSYRLATTPDILFYLGALAFAQGRTLDAHDLMRRYLAEREPDSTSVSPSTTEVREAQRVLSLPVPPHGKLDVLGDGGALVSLDGRLVGSLPLGRPLLVAPGAHKIGLESGSQRAEESVQVSANRFIEVRYNAAAHTFLVDLLPVALVLDSAAGGPGESVKLRWQALKRTLYSEHMSAIDREQALDVLRDPVVEQCLERRDCQLTLAQGSGVDYLLAVTPRGDASGGGRGLVLELFDVEVGDLAARAAPDCEGCDAERTLAAVVAAVPPLLQSGRSRPRGRLRVTSQPADAEVYLDKRRLGRTPLSHSAWAGPHELELRLPGHLPHQRSLSIPEASQGNAAVEVALLPEPATVTKLVIVTQGPPPAPRAIRRPGQWAGRVVGSSLFLGGLTLLGFGASALSVNGRCALAPEPPIVVCPEILQTTTVGGGLIGGGIGLLLSGAGLVLGLELRQHLVGARNRSRPHQASPGAPAGGKP